MLYVRQTGSAFIPANGRFGLFEPKKYPEFESL